MFFLFLPSVFLGWSLGSNDAANIFGPPVSSGVIKYKNAVITAAIFVIIGALIGGSAGLHNIGNLSTISLELSSLSLFIAAVTVTVMTYIGLPVSTTQAVVGAIVGFGFLQGSVDFEILNKIWLSWIGTPIGALIFSYIFYKIFSLVFSRFRSIQGQDRFILTLTWIVGIYGSYSLGANNVANVTGVFNGIVLNTPLLALIGGASIALGILTYSKKVMYTVGKKIVNLDHFSAMIVMLGAASTVWIYSLIGVPVSSSQAIVGAVIGIGLSTGTKTFNKIMILKIVFGWIGTPLISGLISILALKIMEVFV
ncbi:MAG: inorganic phosphate transporter [Thermotogota bacterium]